MKKLFILFFLIINFIPTIYIPLNAQSNQITEVSDKYLDDQIPGISEVIYSGRLVNGKYMDDDDAKIRYFLGSKDTDKKIDDYHPLFERWISIDHLAIKNNQPIDNQKVIAYLNEERTIKYTGIIGDDFKFKGYGELELDNGDILVTGDFSYDETLLPPKKGLGHLLGKDIILNDKQRGVRLEGGDIYFEFIYSGDVDTYTNKSYIYFDHLPNQRYYGKAVHTKAKSTRVTGLTDEEKTIVEYYYMPDIVLETRINEADNWVNTGKKYTVYREPKYGFLKESSTASTQNNSSVASKKTETKVVADISSSEKGQLQIEESRESQVVESQRIFNTLVDEYRKHENTKKHIILYAGPLKGFHAINGVYGIMHVSVFNFDISNEIYEIGMDRELKKPNGTIRNSGFYNFELKNAGDIFYVDQNSFDFSLYRREVDNTAELTFSNSIWGWGDDSGAIFIIVAIQ